MFRVGFDVLLLSVEFKSKISLSDQGCRISVERRNTLKPMREIVISADFQTELTTYATSEPVLG